MRTTLTKIAAIFMVVLLWAMVSKVQGQIVTTASTVTTCPGSTEVLVPITVQNFIDVSSISLKLNIQTANVTYLGYTVNSILSSSGGFLMVNGPNPPSSYHVAAAFFGLGSVSIPDGQALFTFRFNVANTSTLTWNLTEQGACQYSDLAGNSLPAVFVDGAINAGLPDGYITSTPFICSGQPADVNIHITSGGAPYTLVYNDGINPDVSVTTSSNPYTFETFPTAATTFTLVSITAAGGCSNSAIVSSSTTEFFPSADVFNVTGGGSFCNGGTGVEVGLDGSQSGVTYELFLNGTTTGQYIAGNGSSLTFGFQQNAGIYTVTGANDCGTVTMNGQAEIVLGSGPEVSLASLPSFCESVEMYPLSGGLPEGGTYSGIGVSENLFYPSIVGQGIYEITYSYADLNGCIGTATANLEVMALPTVSLSASTPVCSDSDPITLYGYPEGGFYAGPGVVDNMFYPANASVGFNTVEYSYTDAMGCSGYATFNIEVLPLPVITFGAVAPVCINSGLVQLNISPAGGWIDGPGAFENEGLFFFSPAEAGTFSITYHYTSVEGCYGSATQEITVMGTPLVNFEPIPDQCSYASDYALSGTPAGGVFSGPGVVNGMFNANLLDPGYYELSYNYTDQYGCSATATQTVSVLYQTALEIYFTDVVCADEDSVMLIGYPSGGIFSGLGVSEGYFLPNTLGEGSYTILYTYTDASGCTNSISGTITVNPTPEIVFNALSPVCLGTEYVALQASPAGGYFDGYNVYQDGDGNWYFYASSIEAGDYTITYHFSNAFNCYASVSQILTVLSIPQVSIDPVADVCFGSAPVQLSATPAGGVFSGPGVMGDQFDPTGLNPDYYTITYTYTDVNGCSNVATTSFYLNALPELYFTAPTSLCIDAQAVELYAYPAGGTFSGPGVTGNMFNTADAGSGTHFITYSYTDDYGCSNSIMDTITVNPLPQPIIVDLPTQVCFNASPVLLTGLPTGGIFSGPGVYFNGNDYEFWPDYAFLGANLIQYQVTNEFGCTNTVEVDIIVNALPLVSIEPVSDLCATHAPVDLIATPAGGVFTGNGVVGNTFDPSLASSIEYNIITYTYTDENGCSNSASISVWVNQAPTVEILQIADLCLISDPVQLYAYPTGGFFSGNGVSNNMFDPALAGIGTHTIEYTYTDPFGCIGTGQISVVVFSTPEVTFAPLANVCDGAGAVELFATPAGGYFVGQGVAGNFFYPETTGGGTYTITYYYNAGGVCSGSASQSITVYTSPMVTLDPVASVCLDANAVVLTGLPEGGVYSGTGVSGNEFIPYVAGAGTFTLTYTYIDPVTGCSGFATQEVTVNNNPVFFSDPSNSSIFAGENTFFQAVGMYANSYQWQVSTDNGISWTDLTNDGVYSGVTSEILTITGATVAMNGNLYQNQAFSNCPTFAFSTSALLTVESNAIDVTAGSVEVCAGEVVIPVSVANLYNVASMSLTLTFDDNTLTYTGFSDLNPALDGGIYSINTVGNQVKLGYFNISPLNFGNGLLVNYHFTSTGGNSDLTWDVLVPGNCEFNNINEDIIPSNYFNGTATVNPLPIAYDVLGGGVYCFGSNGKEISLSNSETDVTYHLLLNGAATAVQLNGTGGTLSFGMFIVPGTYTIHAVNSATSCAAMMTGSAMVAVNAEITAVASDDVTIFDGSSTTLGVIVTGGTAPYTFAWTPVESLDDATSIAPVANPGITTTYTVVVTDQYGCTASDVVVVTVIEPADQFSGFVTYDNAAASPMANTQVDLYHGGVMVATTTTGANGEYEFTDLPVGTYTVVASTTKAWGGGNAADGLLMLKHFVGDALLTGIRFEAGDVTGNGMINGHDALNTLKRFANFIPNYLPVADWMFEQPSVTIDGLTAPVVNIKALCASDVNADYIPPYLKPEPTIQLDRDGSVTVVNGKAELPVIAHHAMTIGAVSLIIHIPSDITVNNVRMSNGDNNVIFNRIENELRIGWYSLTPLQVVAGQAILTMDVQVSQTFNGEFMIDGYSTLSDENAITMRNVGISIPKLSQTSLANTLSSYPNPISASASVQYTMADASLINLSVFNILGERVMTLVNEVQDAGNHMVILNSDELTQGSYLLKLETNGTVLTQMIQIIK